MAASDTDFDPFAWHDCAIWQLEVRADTADETTDALVLHLDYIAEWRSADTGARFRVAPATLAFHGVTDLCIDVDWSSGGFQSAVHEMAIDRIERARLTDQKVYLDRPYYVWTIQLSWPQSGRLSFGAFGYTQTLTRDPIETDEQSLSWEQRGRRV